MSIGKRLREFGLKEFGQLKHLAKELGIAPSNLQKILKDERELTASMLLKLAQYNCDLRWLLTGKRDLWTLTFEVRVRINAKIKELKELYSISDDNLNLEKMMKEIGEYVESKKSNMIPNELHAQTICYHWKVDESISIPQLIKLSEILEVDLTWFLTGEQKSDIQTQNAFLFKYPEIALLMELRKNPVLFKKVKLYVDSVTSSTSTSELEKISNDINSISGSDTTDKQKKEK